MAVSYCGSCGEAAGDAERFCVACGDPLRRPAAAEAGLPAAAEIAPIGREDRIVLQHAVKLLERREHATAVTVLERLCAEQPEWAVARAYLGVTYLRSTRIADARWELEQAVKLAPESFICRTKLAEFLARLGFHDQALEQLDVAISLPSASAESHHAALELRQFCKEKAKGIFYRKTGYPRLKLGRFVPRQRAHSTTTVLTERGG
jgi:hypothetical protein